VVDASSLASFLQRLDAAGDLAALPNGRSCTFGPWRGLRIQRAGHIREATHVSCPYYPAERLGALVVELERLVPP
jgi:hypothetical protein